MTIRVVLGTMFWGAILALLVAVYNGEDQALSLQLFLAVFVLYLTLVMMIRLFAVLPMTASGLVGLWPLPRRNRADDVDNRLPTLRSIESLVVRARDNERVHHQQLRPRLAALALHYLPMYHGVDPSRERARAAEVLGDVYWLIDPAVRDRAPTIPELHQFVGVLTGAPQQREELV